MDDDFLNLTAIVSTLTIPEGFIYSIWPRFLSVSKGPVPIWRPRRCITTGQRPRPPTSLLKADMPLRAHQRTRKRVCNASNPNDLREMLPLTTLQAKLSGAPARPLTSNSCPNSTVETKLARNNS